MLRIPVILASVRFRDQLKLFNEFSFLIKTKCKTECTISEKEKKNLHIVCYVYTVLHDAPVLIENTVMWEACIKIFQTFGERKLKAFLKV